MVYVLQKQDKVQKKKRMKKKEKVKKEKRKEKSNITSVIIPVISLIIIFLAIMNLPIQPSQGIHTTNTTLKFRWIGLAERAFVDDNEEFSSPIIVEKNSEVNLEPGTYYWKTEFLSPVQGFTIDSSVVIAVENAANESQQVQNVGNIWILLEIFKNLRLTGKAVLGVNETLNLHLTEKNETHVIASQYDKDK